MRWQIKGSKLSAHLATSVLRPMYKVWGTALAPDLPTRGRTYIQSVAARAREERKTHMEKFQQRHKVSRWNRHLTLIGLKVYIQAIFNLYP